MSDTYLFLDTETTGFKKAGPLMQEGQARVCQIAMILTDHLGKSLAEVSLLIKPDNWEVSQYNIDTCGITQDDCEKYGVHFAYAVGLFKQLARKATFIVAHNEKFDKGMMQIEEAHCAVAEGRENKFVENNWLCTMESNAHIIGGKSLKNCLKHYCNRSLGENAHNAKYDTEACRDIFFAMRGIKL